MRIYTRTRFFSWTAVDKAVSKHLGFSINHFSTNLKSALSCNLWNIRVKQVIHEHHYHLLTDKETSVLAENWSCPGILTRVQCGRGSVDRTAVQTGQHWICPKWELPTRRDVCSCLWDISSQTCSSLVPLSFSLHGRTVSDMYIDMYIDTKLPQTFSDSQSVHFVHLKAPAWWLLITLPENGSASGRVSAHGSSARGGYVTVNCVHQYYVSSIRLKVNYFIYFTSISYHYFIIA